MGAKRCSHSLYFCSLYVHFEVLYSGTVFAFDFLELAVPPPPVPRYLVRYLITRPDQTRPKRDPCLKVWFKVNSYAVGFAVRWKSTFQYVRMSFCPQNVANWSSSPKNELDELFPKKNFSFDPIGDCSRIWASWIAKSADGDFMQLRPGEAGNISG